MDMNDLEKKFSECVMYDSVITINSNEHYQLFDNFYFNQNKEIWDCDINVSLWFSNMYHNPNQINIIIEHMTNKINKCLSGIKVKKIGLQKYMLIDNYNYYYIVYSHILNHLFYVMKMGMPKSLAPEYILKKMCKYYYTENIQMSKFILEALE